jgi:parvin
LTSFYDDLGMRCERDAFDTLFDHAPDKLQVSPKTVCIFIGIEILQLDVNGDPFSVVFLLNDL